MLWDISKVLENCIISLYFIRHSYGMWLHMINLFLYLIFLAALTSFVSLFNEKDDHGPLNATSTSHEETTIGLHAESLRGTAMGDSSKVIVVCYFL